MSTEEVSDFFNLNTTPVLKSTGNPLIPTSSSSTQTLAETSNPLPIDINDDDDDLSSSSGSSSEKRTEESGGRLGDPGIRKTYQKRRRNTKGESSSTKRFGENVDIPSTPFLPIIPIDTEPLNDTTEKLAILNDEIATINQELTKHARILSSANRYGSDYSKMTPKQQEEIQKKFKTLKTRLDKLQTDQKDLLLVSEQEKRLLEHQLENLRNASALRERTAEHEKVILNSQLEQLRTEVTDHVVKEGRLTEEKGNLLKKLEKRKVIEETNKREINDLHSRNTELANRAVDLERSNENNLRQLDIKVRELDSLAEEQRRAIERKEMEFKDLEMKATRRIERLNQQLDEAKRKTSTDESLIHDLETQKRDIQDSLLIERGKNDREKTQLIREQAEITQKSNEEISRLRTVVDQSFREQQDIFNQLNDVKNMLSRKTRELDDISTITDGLRAQINTLEKNLNIVAAEKASLESKIRDGVRSQQKAQRKKERYKLTIDRLKNEIELLKTNPKQFLEEKKKEPSPYPIYSSEEEETRPPRRNLIIPPITVNVDTGKSTYSSLPSSSSKAQDDIEYEVERHQRDRIEKSTPWVRKADSGAEKSQNEIVDFQSFSPQIPEQARKWRETLTNISNNVDIGNPHRVYEAVEALLKRNHPHEAEFYHHFYLLVRAVEGKAGKKKGGFWVAQTEGLKHLANNIIEAATENITVAPLANSQHFPLSKAELSNGIAIELHAFREKPGPDLTDLGFVNEPEKRYAWTPSKTKPVNPPVYPLPTPAELEAGLPAIPKSRPAIAPGQYKNTIEAVHRQELDSKIVEARKPGSNWTTEERGIASRNQIRYGKGYSGAPLRGIDQRLREYELEDRLDPSLHLFNRENVLIMTYNFWDFIQQKILLKINRAQPNYVVELQDKADHSWTNVVSGTDFNDIVYYLTDHLWQNLQVRQINGSLIRKPSMLSIKKFLDNQAIKRVTDEITQIDEEYIQPWQDRISSMLEAAIDSGFFVSFREALQDLGLKFEIGNPRFMEALKSMPFVSLVAAHYQKTVTDYRTSATGNQINNANLNVSNCIDAARASMGLPKLTTGTDYSSIVSFEPERTSIIPRQNQRLLNYTPSPTIEEASSLPGFTLM
jgi:hypothetical protein